MLVWSHSATRSCRAAHQAGGHRGRLTWSFGGTGVVSKRSVMTTRGISEDALLAQEACFARAFADGDPSIARDLYQPDVVYVSPTVRLYDWPARIDGVERTLEFIALTIGSCADIRYEAVERAIAPGGDAAFVRVEFDWTQG